MALHLKFVSEIHGRLLVRYGSKWINLYAGIPEDAIKADWSEQLAHVTPSGVRDALDNLPADAPPNAAQFRALCTRQSPPLYVHALPAPPADPERVKKALAGLSLVSTNIPARAAEWRERMYELRRTGAATRAQLDAIKQFEASRGGSDGGFDPLGDFTPIPAASLPPAMRDEVAA